MEIKKEILFMSPMFVRLFYKSLNVNIKNMIFNIGSGNPKSINYLVSLIKGDKIFIKKRPGEPDITHANILYANKILNWSPKISIEEGIKMVFEEY